MKLANCNEHPDENNPSLSCWAIRHDDGKRVTTDELWALIQKREPLSDTDIIKIIMTWHDDEEIDLVEFAHAIEAAHGITND